MKPSFITGIGAHLVQLCKICTRAVLGKNQSKDQACRAFHAGINGLKSGCNVEQEFVTGYPFWIHCPDIWTSRSSGLTKCLLDRFWLHQLHPGSRVWSHWSHNHGTFFSKSPCRMYHISERVYQYQHLKHVLSPPSRGPRAMPQQCPYPRVLPRVARCFISGVRGAAQIS